LFNAGTLAWIPTEGNAANAFGVVGEAVRWAATVVYEL
jgi:hypothetical protein